MSIYINYPFGVSGGSVTDPTKLPLAGGTLTGLVYASASGFRNPLNQNFVIDAYNDTGAGTHNYYKFNPYGGGLELPTNSSGIKFGDGTTQVTSALPLIGGTMELEQDAQLIINQNYTSSGAIQINETQNKWNISMGSGYIRLVDNSNNLNEEKVKFSLEESSRFSNTTLVLSNTLLTLEGNSSISGKLSLNSGASTVAPLNLQTGVTPTSSVAGDIWLTAGSIRYKDSTGTERIVADTNRSNTYTTNNVFQNSTSNPTVTINASGSGTALKVTNTGTGESFRVEDETSPDATPFVISNSGRVGIGTSPDATVALTVDGTGIKINGTTLVPSTSVSNSSSFTITKELQITINGVLYAIPLRVV
jgi:hypothetical protein